MLLRVSDAIVSLDLDWRYTYVNERAGALFGRRPEDLVGKHIWTEFPEGVGQPFHRAYERALAEQVPMFFEDHYAPWDRWFENRVYPSPDGLSIFFHEITDRKRAELAERAASQLNHQIIESAHEGIAVFDRSSRYVRVNRPLVVMTQLSERDFLGKRPSEILPASIGDEIEARLARALTGEVVEIHDLAVIRARSRAPAWVSSVLSPLRDDGGEIQGALAFVRDVTDRVRAESATRDSEQRLRLALEAARAGIWDWDLETDRIIWSREHELLWGLTPGGFRGTYQEFAARIHPDDLPALDRSVATARASGDLASEFRVLLPDGSERWIAGSGRVVGQHMLGTVVDITERKRAELGLQLQTQVLEMIAAGASVHASLGALASGIERLAPALVCTILLLDNDGRTLRHTAAPSMPPSFLADIDGAAIGPAAGSCGTAAFTGEAVFTENVEIDPRWEAYRASIRPHGLRSCWSTPLFDRHRRVVGTYALYGREPGLPSAWQRALIATATHVAEVAIESHRSRAEQQTAEEALRRLSATLLRSQDVERRRIARELHDTTGQNLAALAVTLSVLQRRVTAAGERELLDECVALAKLCATEVRTLAYVLHPPTLEDFGLGGALRELATGFMRRTGLDISVEVGEPMPRLPPDHELALYRVAQESLTNVLRHSGSTRATVRMTHNAGAIELEVRDFGARAYGAEPAVGVGIAGMRERLRQAGGRLDVTFGLGGTVVRAALPCGERTP